MNAKATFVYGTLGGMAQTRRYIAHLEFLKGVLQ